MFVRRSLCFMWSTIAACALVPVAAVPAQPPHAFAAFTSLLDSAPSYSMRIDSHEVLGDRSEEISYVYERSPAGAQLRILAGRGTGARISYRFGQSVVGVHAGFFISGNVTHVPVHDPAVTSLRGNGIAETDLNVLRACFAAHRATLSETSGPRIDGVATSAIVFEHRGERCANVSRADRDVTTDVLYIAADGSGVPLLRKSYAGREIVEQWRIHAFAVEPGPRS